MSSHNVSSEVLAVKDESAQRPIPTAWRPILREIVGALSSRDYQLKRGLSRVAAVPAETALHIQNYIQDYGATLVKLPEEAWASSVCIWMGDYWDVLLDLWTQEEGQSDLVLSARVTEAGFDFAFKIQMVYVP